MDVQPVITDLISQKIKCHVTGYSYMHNEDETCTPQWFVF